MLEETTAVLHAGFAQMPHPAHGAGEGLDAARGQRTFDERLLAVGHDADLLVAGVQAAGAKQIPRAVVARLAVDVGDVLVLDVERLLRMLGEQPVERPLPAIGVQRRRRGQDAVEIEEHGVVLSEIRMRRHGSFAELGRGRAHGTSGAHPHPEHAQGAGCGSCPDVPPRRLEQARQMPRSQNEPAPRHRVVIVGGGFGGLQAALRLRRAPVDVTLIDRRNFHLFQPLLYQVAAGAVSAAEIAQPLRSIFRRQQNVSVILGEVSRVDLERRRVLIDGAGDTPAAVPYDTLIVAAGSRYVYFGHDEWRPFAPEIKTLEGALDVRRRILRAFEAAELEHDAARRAAWLTFVVVGAGPTGVEIAGQIAEIARETLRRDFRAIDPREARILIVDRAERVLATFPPSLSAKAERALERLGITPLLGRTVVGIDDEGVTLQPTAGDPERVPARTAIWAAGVGASPLAGMLARFTGAELDRTGRVTRRARPVAARAPRGAGARRHGAGADDRRRGARAAGHRPGGDAAGPLRRPARPRSPPRRRDAAVPLRRQGQPGHDRPRTRGRRRSEACASAGSPPG